MNILLDTNIIVSYFRGKTNLVLTGKNNLYLSVVSYIELLYGAEKSRKPRQNQQLLEEFIDDYSVEIVSLEKEMAKLFVKEKKRLETGGKKIEDYDLFIAAAALYYGFHLATLNNKHFSRVKNLKLIPIKDIIDP